MTLGLNVIVGPGEEKELERCLKSACQGNLFDEIVVTVTSEDRKVREVACAYADKVEYFEWVDDFSAARNYSFGHNTADYIMWLDADDEIKPEEFRKLVRLKSEIPEFDVILLDYAYTHDENDLPRMSLVRERIVKNSRSIRWREPVHEHLDILGVPKERVLNSKIRIDHYRTRPYNAERNISILKKAYDSHECTPRTRFYYGKELAEEGRWDEALPVLEDLVRRGEGWDDNLMLACVILSKYYFNVKHDYESVKKYSRMGIRYNGKYAECHVILGMAYEAEKDYESAENSYKEALEKKFGSTLMSQMRDYYGFIPAARLALLYSDTGRYRESVVFCDKALEYKPGYQEILRLKEDVLEHVRMKSREVISDSEFRKLSNLLSRSGYKASLVGTGEGYADIRLEKFQNIRVCWLLSSICLDDPSLRIRRVNCSKKLKQLGIDSRVIPDYHSQPAEDLIEGLSSASAVVFSAYSIFDLELMEGLRRKGVNVIFDHCEALFGYPYENECMSEADLIVCCSTKLEEMTRDRGFSNTVVIKDAIEEKRPSQGHSYKNSGKLRAGYFGMGGNSFLVNEYLKDVIELAGYELVLCTEWENATHKWDRETWPDLMNSCDVVLCPQRVDVQPAKSNVKATTAMALGLPVICSPLQAYEEVVDHGVNGFIADSRQEWLEALTMLRDEKVRERVGRAALESVGDYTLEAIGHRWRETLERLVDGDFKPGKKGLVPCNPVKKEPVDIIIPSYNNVEYLKLCVNSILRNTLHPFHIVISDAGSDEDTWEYLDTLKGVTVLGDRSVRLSFSEACNAGIRNSRTEFFAVLNSDVIVSKGWLSGILGKMENESRLAACGVLSNCDAGWLFNRPGHPDPWYDLRVNDTLELYPGMKLETILPHLDDLYGYMLESNRKRAGKFVEQKWVAAYATVFARSAIEEVGLFDPQFKNGCEDLDLMIRLRKLKFRVGQALDSFVFHFGGVSRASYEQELTSC